MTTPKRFEPINVKRSPIDPDAGYVRRVKYVEITFTCTECGKTHTVEQLPGRKPKYCRGVNGEKSNCEKIANKKRVEKHRDNKRKSVNSQDS